MTDEEPSNVVPLGIISKADGTWDRMEQRAFWGENSFS